MSLMYKKTNWAYNESMGTPTWEGLYLETFFVGDDMESSIEEGSLYSFN